MAGDLYYMLYRTPLFLLMFPVWISTLNNHMKAKNKKDCLLLHSTPTTFSQQNVLRLDPHVECLISVHWKAFVTHYN